MAQYFIIEILISDFIFICSLSFYLFQHLDKLYGSIALKIGIYR